MAKGVTTPPVAAPTTTYTAQRPEVREGSPKDYEELDVVSGFTKHPDGLQGGQRGKLRRRRVPAVPTAQTDEGDKYWPVFVRNDGATPHPHIVAHDLASGEAELLTDEDEVVRIIDRLRKEAGGIEDDVMYVRCITASVRGSRVKRSVRLASLLTERSYDAAPDGPDGTHAWLVPIEDVAELLSRPVSWVKAASGSDLPSPIKIRQAWYYNSVALARCLAP